MEWWDWNGSIEWEYEETTYYYGFPRINMWFCKACERECTNLGQEQGVTVCICYFCDYGRIDY